MARLRTEEVLSAANRGVARFESLSTEAPAETHSRRYVIQMTEAAQRNTSNTFQFFVYGSRDNFVTRQFLGSAGDPEPWRGGTILDKQGNLVPIPLPAVTLEITPQMRGLKMLAAVEAGNGMRWSLVVEDDD